jgi:hypothetical protein
LLEYSWQLPCLHQRHALRELTIGLATDAGLVEMRHFVLSPLKED